MAGGSKEEAPVGLSHTSFLTRTLTSIVFAVVWMAGTLIGFQYFVLPLLCIVVAALGLHEFMQLTRRFMPLWAVVLLGFFYLAVPLGCFLGLRSLRLSLAVTLMLSVWGADSAAYIFGSTFGRHKLAPKLSPKKSWEGFLAGVVISMLVWVIVPLLFSLKGWGLSSGLIFGGTVACAGLAGDLLESHLKRRAGVKDAGTILPGHGGVLDRFDSLLVAAPVTLLAFGLWTLIRLVRL